MEKIYYKKGLILIYPGYQNEAKIFQYNRLIEEFEKLGIQMDKLKVDEVTISVKNSKFELSLEYDFCIQLVSDKYINVLLKKSGIRSFNSYEAIENCDNKMMTYCIIADNGIKLPLSISANTNTGIESIDEQVLSDNFKNQVEKMLNYPLIIKKSHSKGGKGIYKINNRKDLDNICNELKGGEYLFQEFISVNSGKDIRVILVGAKVIGSFIRENDNDFRSNLSLGGKAIPYSITPEYKKIAEKTAKLLKLDYCSVDFFVNENEPMICEVNPDPALQSGERLINKNIANIYAKYIYNKIYSNSKGKNYGKDLL